MWVGVPIHSNVSPNVQPENEQVAGVQTAKRLNGHPASDKVQYPVLPMVGRSQPTDLSVHLQRRGGFAEREHRADRDEQEQLERECEAGKGESDAMRL